MKQLYSIIRRSLASGLVCALLITAGAPDLLATTDDAPGEYQLKAAFLFNFAKFIEWPSDHSSDHPDNIIFTIVGDDPVLSENSIGQRYPYIKHGASVGTAARLSFRTLRATRAAQGRSKVKKGRREATALYVGRLIESERTNRP
jgi:hypothetical protein